MAHVRRGLRSEDALRSGFGKIQLGRMTLLVEATKCNLPRFDVQMTNLFQQSIGQDTDCLSVLLHVSGFRTNDTNFIRTRELFQHQSNQGNDQ